MAVGTVVAEAGGLRLAFGDNARDMMCSCRLQVTANYDGDSSGNLQR